VSLKAYTLANDPGARLALLDCDWELDGVSRTSRIRP
jgi:hypothetical protein